MTEEFESEEFEQELPIEEPEGEIGDAQSAPQSAASFIEAFKASGVPVPEGVNEDAIRDYVLGSLQFRNKVSDQELAELYQYRARYAQESDEPTPTQKQKVDEPSKPAFLSFPDGIEQYVRLDERTKRYIPSDERFPNIKAVEAANAFLDQRKKWEQKLFSNPIEFLDEVGLKDREARLRAELKQEILNEIQGKQSQQANESQLNAFWEEHGSELLQTDAKGNRQYDFQGNPVLTRKGQAFDQAVKEAEEYGIKDPLKLVNFAYKQVQNAWKRQKPAEQGSAKQSPESAESVQDQEESTPEQGKKAFIAKAKAEDAAGKQTVRSRVVNRDATVASAARSRDSQNPNLSFKEMLKANFKAAGQLKED